MNKIKYIRLLATCTAIGLLYFAFSNSSNEIVNAQTKPEVSKFALLIGINQYKVYPAKENDKNIRHLNGTNNDVAMMKDLLVNTYEFKADKTANSPIKTLLNSEATQDGIRKAFVSQLIQKAKEYQIAAKVEPKDGATIVLFYSGHGAKKADQNGDETDGIDETIVPHDSDTSGTKDIIDDEFDQWLTELKNYTTNITFIFDSCHSGTVTRGGVSKSVYRNIVVPNNSKGGGTTPQDGMTRNESYVTISGSLPKEESQEDVFTDPDNSKKSDWNGALTFSLVHLLRLNPNMTYREAMRQVQAKVISLDKNQTPQVEGDIDRQIFGSSATRQKSVPIFIEDVKVVKKNINTDKPEDIVEVNEIKMKVGSIVGAGSGAAIAVFGKKPNSKIIEQIGSGAIIDPTDEFTSTGEVVLTDKTMTEVPKDATVRIVSPSFGKTDKQTIALDTTVSNTDASSKVFAGIETKLKENAMVKTVQAKDILDGITLTRGKSSIEVSKSVGDWDVAVVRADYTAFVAGNIQPVIKAGGKGNVPKCAQKRFYGTMPTDDEQGFFISNRLGQPLYNLWYSANDAEAAECLADALDKFARIQSLRKLSSGGSGLNDGLKVELIRLKSFDYKNFNSGKCVIETVSEDEQKKDQNTTPKLKPGDFYYFKVTNNSEFDLYTYIYTLTTDGKISMLFPPKGADKSEILPKRGGTYTTNQKIGPGNCGVFFIEPLEKSPPGIETLKVIATTKVFPGEILEQPGIAKGIRGPSLSQLIRQTATGTRSGTMQFEVSDWATKNVDIEIVQ